MMPSSSAPLTGLRVLDLSRVLAGPWSTQMLADLGADVVKIEKPGEGDDTRGWGPPFVTAGDGTQGDAAYFISANRGKRSVAVDIAAPAGAALIRRLAERSDIMVENFKLGGLKKYGLDYESLKTINPALIYCSITGFGQNGPYAARAGYDFMIQGLSGLMSITGEPDGRPMKTGVAFADVFAGLHAVIGILAALHHRDKTGHGQYIDLALLDSQIAVLANQTANYLIGNKVPKRLGNEHPNIVPYQTFETGDGHIIIAVGNDRQFSDYVKIIGLPELASDSRFMSNRGRVENRRQLTAMLQPAMRKKSTGDWMSALQAKSIPCGPINTLDQVFADPQVVARGLKISLPRDDGPDLPLVANPIRFSETPVGYHLAPPRLGHHTDEVLQTLLGLREEDIKALRAAGTIG